MGDLHQCIRKFLNIQKTITHMPKRHFQEVEGNSHHLIHHLKMNAGGRAHKSGSSETFTSQKYSSFNVWVRDFVWNFKGYLWNYTQNILPIYWKINLIHCSRALRFMSPYVFSESVVIMPESGLPTCCATSENNVGILTDLGLQWYMVWLGHRRLRRCLM